MFVMLSAMMMMITMVHGGKNNQNGPVITLYERVNVRTVQGLLTTFDANITSITDTTRIGIMVGQCTKSSSIEHCEGIIEFDESTGFTKYAVIQLDWLYGYSDVPVAVMSGLSNVRMDSDSTKKPKKSKGSEIIAGEAIITPVPNKDKVYQMIFTLLD
jgi:hypothetical protein